MKQVFTSKNFINKCQFIATLFVSEQCSFSFFLQVLVSIAHFFTPVIIQLFVETGLISLAWTQYVPRWIEGEIEPVSCE